MAKAPRKPTGPTSGRSSSPKSGSPSGTRRKAAPSAAAAVSSQATPQPQPTPSLAQDMAAAAPWNRAAERNLPRRSMGLKLLLVCGLALLMSIPALFVFGLLMDRSQRAEQVAEEVGGMMGGPQTFLGPVIAVPFTQTLTGAPQGRNPAATSVQTGVWYIFPTQGQAVANTRSEVRSRSLFHVPVYEADVTFNARFDLSRAGADVQPGTQLDWSRAELIMGASDARGARSDIVASIGGRAASLTPALTGGTVGLAVADDADHRQPRNGDLQLFGARLTEAERTAAPPLEVTGQMTFSGARRIAFLAFAGTTQAEIRGDWPHPSYNGLARNNEDAATEAGFDGKWSVPLVGRGGVPLEGDSDVLTRLGKTEMAVTFVEPGNPYQAVGRSLKYAPMFIGLVFLAYFLLETTSGRRVHPAQYVLIGLAQVIFYMLLLSIAEYVGFNVGFLIAAVATVSLISAYAGWTFKSRREGLIALVAFSALYGLIYLLMRLNDAALLVGALASFAAIAAVMYFTRNVDWYGVTGSHSDAKDVA